jgi:5-hydroxyisourate hydrolase
MKSPISTPILDTALGRPAQSVLVVLEIKKGKGFSEIAKGRTNTDGRASELLPANHVLVAGTYRLTFDTDAYFTAVGATSFYPTVQITFTITDPGQHYHVPLLLSPYGYSTYRGS